MSDAQSDRLPDVHFGDVEDDELPPESDLDEADDDEELAVTPTDVVEMLGFDPLELDDVTGDDLVDDEFQESDHPRDREGKFARAGRAVAGRVRQRASSVGAALRELSGEQREKLKEHFERGSEDRNQAVRHLRNVAELPVAALLHSLGEEAGKVKAAASALRSIRSGDYDPEHVAKATELGNDLVTSLLLSTGSPEEFITHVVHHVVMEHAVKWAAAGGTLMHEKVRESVARKREARLQHQENTTRRVGEIAEKYRGYTGDEIEDASLTDVEVVREFLLDVADALETRTVDELLDSDRSNDQLARDAGLY